MNYSCVGVRVKEEKIKSYLDCIYFEVQLTNTLKRNRTKYTCTHELKKKKDFYLFF